MNIKTILLLGLTKSAIARIEFWQDEQKKSGYSEQVFLSELIASLDYYSKEVEKMNIVSKERSVNSEDSNIGLPLFSISYDLLMNGHLGRHEIGVLAGSLQELRNKWLDSQAVTMDFDKTPLTASNVIPYCEVKNVKGAYSFYEGAIGNNRFQYFEVSKNSKEGKLWKKYDKKIKDSYDAEKRYNYFGEFNGIIETAITDASVRKLSGLDAYLKYWNDCFTDEEKIKYYFGVIPHFEALKNWYELSLNDYIRKHDQDFLTSETKEVEVSKWKDNIYKEVKAMITIISNSNNGMISSAHAIELNKFYEWLKPLPGKRGNRNSSLTAPVIALFAFIVKDAQISAQGATENNSAYCRKICTKFNLPYTDRVRQCFGSNMTNKNVKYMKARLLPLIDKAIAKKITEYIENKKGTNGKLYG